MEPGDETDEHPAAGVYVTCPLPQLPTPLECGGDDGALAKYPQSDEDTFGWYYCENSACEGGEDEKGNKCCQYGVILTHLAEKRSAGNTVKIQCLQEFTFEDDNCQENTYEACNDGKDNDGNLVFDCNNDFTGEKPHLADRKCCRLKADSCEIDPVTFTDVCREDLQGNPHTLDNPPDACAAQIKRCLLDNQ